MKRSATLLLAIALLAILFTSVIFAGGPASAVSTTPRKYPSSAFPLAYRTDQGGLGAFTNTTATSIASYAFTQWDNVSSAALSFSNAGQLARNVTTATDAYISGATQFSDGVNPVVFDSSGAITDAKLGTGAKNVVLGFASSAYSGTSYIEGYAIINGALSGSGSTSDQDYYKATMTHEIGHFLGLGHSQDGMHADFATLYPSIQKSAQRILTPDDTASIALIYPNSGYIASVGSISGTVKRPNNANLSGVNVIAIDSVSGASYSTVVDYFSGNDNSRFSSQPSASGSYTISGLPPGRYFVRIEPVHSEFSGGSALASYSTPSNTSTASEWYNGGSESGDMLQDNTNQKTGVTVTANSTTTSINFIANESSTLSTLVYDSGVTYGSFALPQSGVTKYATRFTAPANGSLLGLKFHIAGYSTLPLNGTLTVSVHANASGGLAGIPAATALGSVTIPFSDLVGDAENEIWLRGLGTAVNFNSGDNFHIVLTTNGNGTLVLLGDNGATTQNRSSYYTSSTGWQNYPQGGYSAGYNLMMTAVYTTSAAGNPQPAVTLNPTSLDFGRKRPGDSLDKTITLTNSGQATLNVTATPVAGADSASFRVVSGGGAFSLSASASRTITVRFKPLTAGGTKSATLSIVSNATSSPDIISLSGVGVQPNASKLTSTIAFGSKRTGGVYNQTVGFIRNTGNDTLHISSLALSGSDAGGGIKLLTATGASILPPDSILNVAVRFEPTQRRAYSATLTVNHDDPLATTSLTISGTGIAPVVTTARDTAAFGNVRANATKDTTFTIRNTGDAPLVISAISLTGGDSSTFSLPAPPSFPVTVNAGDSLVVRLRFAPTQQRAYTTTLRLTHDASPATSEYAVTGRGVAAAIDAPASFIVGNVRVGSNADAPALVIRNTGDASMTVTALNLTGAMASDFTVTGSTPVVPATIPPGDSMVVQIRFQPSARGARSATLSIVSNALTSPVATVMLQGNGMQGELSANPQTIDFGDLLVGTPRLHKLVFSNPGSAPLKITGINISGNSSSAFTLSPAGTFPITIQPGDSISLDLTFLPTSATAFAGMVTVANDGPTPSFVVAISGRGITPGLALSRSSYSFGTVPVNTSRQGSFFVMNTGTAPLTGVTVQIAGSNAFDVSPAGPFSVQPGDSTEVIVTLKPQAAPTTLAGKVKVMTSGGANSEVTLSGTVVAGSIETLGTIDFGKRNVGSTNDTTFFVRNTGSIVVQIDSARLISGDESFAVVSGVPVSIAPGDSARVTARFQPAANGTYSGIMELYTMDGSISIQFQGNAASTSSSVASETITTGQLHLSLLPVVPNPVAGMADVAFSIGGTGRVPVSVTLVDLRGAVVARLFDGVVEAGSGVSQQHLQLDAGTLGSGEYYLVMKGGGERAVRKIVVVR
jgi:hypothetical protein